MQTDLRGVRACNQNPRTFGTNQYTVALIWHHFMNAIEQPFSSPPDDIEENQCFLSWIKTFKTKESNGILGCDLSQLISFQ